MSIFLCLVWFYWISLLWSKYFVRDCRYQNYSNNRRISMPLLTNYKGDIEKEITSCSKMQNSWERLSSMQKLFGNQKKERFTRIFNVPAPNHPWYFDIFGFVSILLRKFDTFLIKKKKWKWQKPKFFDEKQQKM